MADLKTTNIFGDAYINNKVGIATNAPATRLQIGQLSPTAATEGIQFGDDTSTRIYRSSSGTLTLNGVVAGLSLSASTALYGNYGDWSGESNKIQWHSNNLYFVNRGGGSWIFRNSSAANVVDIASNGTTTISGNISAANLSGTNTGDQTIGNGTITIAAGTGIGVGTSNTFTTNQSGATTVTVTNSGVTSNVAGTGISVSGATGAVTITNSGVTSAVAGTGISVSGATGAVTITNSGVTSLAGTTNRITVSAGTGGVTLNLPQDIHTGASPTFSGLSLTSVSTTGATITNLTGAYQNTTVYDSPRTQSATPSRGIRAPASSIQFTDSYAIAPFYTYRSTGDWPVPYGIGWGTGGESSGIFQRYASNGSSFGDMIFYTGNDGSGAFSFRRHTWEGTTYFAQGSGELNTELFRIDWSGNVSMLGTLNGSANSATLYPNNGTYGSWRIGGTRNSWYGLEFESGVSLMANSGEVGFYRNGSGWQMRWYNGAGYIYKSNPGGGTESVILDSSNASYAWNMNQNVRTTDNPTFGTLQLTRLNFGAAAAAPYAAASGEGYGNGITFGGDENSAAYRIFTGMENIGGNYSKLTLNWHTGIRIGAYFGYGGIRFYNNYVGAGTKVFSIAEGDDNVRVANELFVGTDNIGAYKFMKYGGARSGDWQLFTTSSVGAGQMNVIQVENIAGGGHTNYPTGVYPYGGVMSWRLPNHSFQLYAAHTGDLAYKTQWNNDNYSGWRRILDSTNYPYAANMNQYVRTTDNPTFGTVTAALSGNATTATTLQTARAINGVNFNGSAAITVNGLNYNVNNEWLRENGDDAHFQMYGNSRTMIYRTDGNTNTHGGGAYAHIFYYGGSADANRMFIINTDGRLWSNYHGWLDTMSTTGNAATATSAGCVNSDTGNVGGSRLQYWQTSGNTALNPDGEWYNAIRMGHGDPVTYYSNTLAIRMTGGNLGDIYTRTTTNGATGSWNRFWHNNNDGAGSGLDADLLDGYGSATANTANTIVLRDGSGNFSAGTITATLNGNASFATSAGSVISGAYVNANNTFTGTNVQNSPNNTFINTVSNANQSLTFYQGTAGADAYMTFHVGGDFAGYFGLGGAENDLVYGGWSVGNNRYRILHSGNASFAWNMNQNVRTTDTCSFAAVTATTFTGALNGSAASLVSVNTYTVGALNVNGMTQLAGVKETYVAVSPSSNVVTIDLNAGTVFRMTYNSVISSFTISNLTSAKVNSFTLISIASAGAGGITFTFSGYTLKWAGGTAPTATTTAGKFDVFSFIYDGTNWYGFTGGLNY